MSLTRNSPGAPCIRVLIVTEAVDVTVIGGWFWLPSTPMNWIPIDVPSIAATFTWAPIAVRAFCTDCANVTVELPGMFAVAALG